MDSLSVAQLGTFLAMHFNRDVSDIAALGRGTWSSAFAFRCGGHNYVVRFGSHREDFAKDRLAAQYASPALSIPTVVEVGEAFGGYYAISERVFGDYIDDVDEGQMRTLLPSLFGVFDAMRLADLSGTTGYGLWGEDGHAPYPSWRAFLLDADHDRPSDRARGWRARLASSSVGVGPFEEAYARLRALVEHLLQARHLVHSDLLHYNVLVQNDQMTGVLDWGCGMYGDFLYDLAWFCFWQPWYPAWHGIDFRAEALRHYAAIGLDVPCFAERLRCCQIHIGLRGEAFMAYDGNWLDLPQTAQRTLDLARGS